jgi:L-seryl-tRNA(Ser) seleniumtransferase
MSDLQHDRFGNPFATGVPYARGDLIGSTADDLRKLGHAWSMIRNRIVEGSVGEVFNFSGLERRFEMLPNETAPLDDELAPALLNDQLRNLGLEHMGGKSDRHDMMMFNRQTAAILTATLTMVAPSDTVIGASPTYSHPCVIRAVNRANAKFIDTVGVADFSQALDAAQSAGERVSVVALTRLAVSYEIMPQRDIEKIISLARAAGARILVDDAGGARVGPAIFDQPKSLEFDVDIASTGLDKYGTIGPRLGLLAGDKQLVADIRAIAFELGVEARPMLYPAVVHSLSQYDPQRVRDLVTTTKEVGELLKSRFGNRVTETPVTAQLKGEDILEMAMERAGITEHPIKPIEATAGLAMAMARDHGILSVHLAGLPPGTAALMFKFIPPETLARFGGSERFVDAVDQSIDTLAAAIGDPERLRSLLFGTAETA